MGPTFSFQFFHCGPNKAVNKPNRVLKIQACSFNFFQTHEPNLSLSPNKILYSNLALFFYWASSSLFTNYFVNFFFFSIYCETM